MFKIAVIGFVLAVALTTANGDKCLKRCTREFQPVVAFAGDVCEQFSNRCMMENAILCQKMDADFCARGRCDAVMGKIKCVRPGN